MRVGNIKSRGSRLVGGKIEYRESGIFKRVSYKPFVIEKQVRGDRFERSGKRTARIFYPAAQEYGAANAKPPIKAKRQMKRATDSKRISAQRVFRGKFVRSFRKFASEIGFF